MILINNCFIICNFEERKFFKINHFLFKSFSKKKGF